MNIQKYKVGTIQQMVGPQDGGFGFDGAPKYSNLEGKSAICVQCQAGQHGKCLAKNNPDTLCDCELCMIS
ncbi:MAG: hypothetical protein LV477_02610 [Candidatus Nitrosotalea sp.]|nr:hypothetical protein [Candidatus Nitrosotalea sp.]